MNPSPAPVHQRPSDNPVRWPKLIFGHQAWNARQARHGSVLLWMVSSVLALGFVMAAVVPFYYNGLHHEDPRNVKIGYFDPKDRWPHNVDGNGWWDALWFSTNSLFVLSLLLWLPLIYITAWHGLRAAITGVRHKNVALIMAGLPTLLLCLLLIVARITMLSQPFLGWKLD